MNQVQTNLGQKFVWTPNLYLDDLSLSSVSTTYPADFVTFYIFKMGNVGFFGEFKNFKMAAISCYVSLFFWCTGFALATRDSPRVLYCMEREFEEIITNFEWALRTTITNCRVSFIAFYLTCDQMLGKKDRLIAGYLLFGISYPTQIHKHCNCTRFVLWYYQRAWAPCGVYSRIFMTEARGDGGRDSTKFWTGRLGVTEVLLAPALNTQIKCIARY